MGTQTVRETLMFYANMKLPSTYSEKKKKAKVEQVLVELGLTKVADSLIGSQFQRGISGGEKKRVSIGCELITNPSLLFCDEPTTGLDAYNAMVSLSFNQLRRHRSIIDHLMTKYEQTIRTLWKTFPDSQIRKDTQWSAPFTNRDRRSLSSSIN